MNTKNSECKSNKSLWHPIKTWFQVTASATLLLMTSIPFSFAQVDPGAKNIEEIVTIGTRKKGRVSTDLAVAVDSLSAEDMLSTGQTEVGRMLQNLAPSFNFSSSTISDGTDALRPATLRGLGPDQTLVLVNGKRRHTGALIHVNTSVGRGAAGVDMNAIPASAIKRIEVLRDGAAAQYGSDAIAGVINIVLKDDGSAGSLNVSYGGYSEGDGETITVNASNSFELGDSGYLTASFEYRDRENTNRAGLTGQCQYTCTTVAGVQIASVATEDRERAFNRKNFRIGDSDSEQLALVFNAGMELGDGDLYGFLTYSDRESESAGFYRRANQGSNNPVLDDGEAFYPDGFLPRIGTEIDDISFGGGFRTELWGDVSLDVSLTHGRNDFQFTINNSINASQVQLAVNNLTSASQIRSQTPRSADAGKLGIALTTFNIDMVTQVDERSLAWGFEYRIDDYSIDAGSFVSYGDFDGVGGGNAGIQVFPGFQPGNEVDEDRDVVSLYFDAENEITERILLSAAVRYDDYSDFGDTFNFKLAGRIFISDSVTFRAGVSTGFRAPSMQQLYFNNVSTQFNGMGMPVDVGTFRNDSVLANAIGIPDLKEEESLNISLGAVFQLMDGWSLTLDYYNINIEDRIVLSEQLTSGLGSAILDAALLANQVTGAQFFLNAVDTETSGIDLISTYNMGLGDGNLRLTFAANVTNTNIEDVFSPGGLQGISPNSVYGAQARSIVEDWQPKDRINISANYSVDNYSVYLAFNRFGEYTVLDGGQSQTFGDKVLTDLRVVYDFNERVSVNLGGNNIFDVTPDGNKVGQSRTGTIVDSSMNQIVQSAGVFEFNRRSAPFGFNGAYYYAGVSYSF